MFQQIDRFAAGLVPILGVVVGLAVGRGHLIVGGDRLGEQWCFVNSWVMWYRPCILRAFMFFSVLPRVDLVPVVAAAVGGLTRALVQAHQDIDGGTGLIPVPSPHSSLHWRTSTEKGH